MLKLAFKIFLSLIFGYGVLAPLLIIAVIVNYFNRRIIAVLFRFNGHGKFKLISKSVDSLFATLSPDEDGAILAIILANYQDPEIEAERRLFQTILAKTNENGEELYSKLKLIPTIKFSYACFKEDAEFSVYNHVRQISMTPEDGDCFSESEFFEKVVPYLRRNFEDLSRPRWEFVIVPKLMFESNLKTAQVFRFNHAYMDGASMGMFLMENILNFEAQSNTPFVLDPKKSLGLKLSFQKYLVFGLGVIRLPYQLAEQMLQQICKGLQTKSSSRLDLPLTELFDNVYGVSKPINVSTVKERAKYSKSQTIGVLAELVRKSLVIHLQQRGVDLAGKDWTVSVPSAILPYKDSKPRNQVFLSSHSFPFESEIISPLKPLSTCFLMFHCLNIFSKFPAVVLKTLLRAGGESLANSTSLNSLPFTRVRGKLLETDDQWVEDVGGYIQLVRGMGLAILVVRYNEKVRFWCSSNRGFMNKEELREFVRILESDLDHAV